MILTCNLLAEGIPKGTAEKTQRSTQRQKAGFGSVFSILPAQIFGKAEQKQERDWAFRYAKNKLKWSDEKANQFADAYLNHFKISSYDRNIAIREAINDIADSDQSWWDSWGRCATASLFLGATIFSATTLTGGTATPLIWWLVGYTGSTIGFIDSCK